MTTKPKWQYDEMEHCGIDYNDIAQVEVYDKRHQKFRDYQKEDETIIKLLGLNDDEAVIDMGCGTGAFALHAAKKCKKIYAVDVSKCMLEYASHKAKEAGLDNIDFYHGGFLTYKHHADPVDVIVSVVALHHLPDFWKLIGLKRLATMLKHGGKLYLFDVVFSFDMADYKQCLTGWVKATEERMGSEIAAEIETHASDEYSTFDWIMEGLLEKAGFEIEKKNYMNGLLASYVCTKSK